MPTPIVNCGSFRAEDTIILLNDITGLIEPKPAEERERLIQNGVHYSEMLPLEYKPSARYVAEYERALRDFASETAAAVASVAEKIYFAKGDGVALVSLARAGTPIGVLLKHYLLRKYGVDAPHYTLSIVRGRGIDGVAMRYVLDRHAFDDIQFVDGWTGKGAILAELSNAAERFANRRNVRGLLAVLADPANVTDMCGTHEDIPIASAFLNATVCGLMSRTVIRPGIGADEFHGAVFYDELRGEDRTYEFIDAIERFFDISDMRGVDEVRRIAAHFGIDDINFIKPGIGEATRVLLRRLPDMLLLSETAEPKHTAHLIQLANEKNVPIFRYPLTRYKACGIIKDLSSDV